MENNKLRELRLNKRLNQQNIAECLGITTSYYGMIENGVRTPNLILAYEIAKYFNTTIENIFFSLKTT